jgi:hypothetical protein
MMRTTLALAAFLALELTCRADDLLVLNDFAKRHHATVSKFGIDMYALVFTDKATDDDMGALEKSAPKIFSALDLGNASLVTDAGFLQLKSMACVLNLDLPREVTNKGVADLKKRFPSATQIRYLATDKKGALDNDGVKTILEVETLRDLSLSHGRFDDGIWESLGKCPKLRSLSVRSGAITGKGMLALKGCPDLTQVYLFECPLGKGVGESIAKMPALWSLSLNGSTVGNDEMAPLAEMQTLKVLTLSGTTVGDAGLLKLAPSKSLGSVTSVTSKVTKEGVEKLKKLNPKIEVVN